MELFKEVKQDKPRERDDIDQLKADVTVSREIHIIKGLLRFSPDMDGVYIARCAPCHFILPALAEHFTQRFGEAPWVIIDERRNICLCREKGGETRLIDLPASLVSGDKDRKDAWQELWCLYHKSINNEARSNPRLQQQLIPKRYHKYLCEMNNL